jgi:L-malate glycosyltransferase
MNKPKIICVHHLDDFSGSPRVLANVIEGLQQQNWEVILMTNRQSEGFLKQLNVKKVLFDYDFHKNKFKRISVLAAAQWAMFRAILRFRNEKVVVYINTLLPFGAALGAWITGQKVVYHFHEVTIPFAPLRWIAKSVAKLTATKGIFVSEYLQKSIDLLPKSDTIVAYNGLNPDFWEKATNALPDRSLLKVRQNILMLCSLKDYKGIPEFIALAKQMPTYNFELVINSSLADIKIYFKNHQKSHNLQVFPSQSDTDSFYRRADMVLNLSRPEGWIESFGMTLVEAFAYGIPVIGPEIGGPEEIISDNYNGFKINGTNLEKLKICIQQCTADAKLYIRYANNARESAHKYQSKVVQQLIYSTLIGVTNLEYERENKFFAKIISFNSFANK